MRPSNWYLTGFLIPSDTPFEERSDDDEEDALDETPEVAGLAEESAEERRAAKRGFFPSSMGLSFLVSKETEGLEVTVRWGDYRPGEAEGADGKPLAVWERTAQERASWRWTWMVRLDYPVPESKGLRLHVVSRAVDVSRLAGLPRGRPVGVGIPRQQSVIRSRPSQRIRTVPGLVDRAYAFQAELEVSSNGPFVPRPDPRGARSAEWDDQIADLHYSDTPEYAVGHGVSAEWGDGRRRVSAAAYGVDPPAPPWPRPSR